MYRPRNSHLTIDTFLGKLETLVGCRLLPLPARPPKKAEKAS